MSDKWERSTNDWYNNSRTVNLEYLDLATSATISNGELAHNLAVIYDRICLSSKVQLKHLKSLLEENQKLQKEVIQLRQAVSNLTTVCIQQRPLSKKELLDLVAGILLQPKQIEQQVFCLLNQVSQRLEQIEISLSQIGKYFSK